MWGVIDLKITFPYFRTGGKGNAVQTCYSCHGNGIKISIQSIGPGMVQQVQRVCPDCQGDGMPTSLFDHFSFHCDWIKEKKIQKRPTD